MQQQMNRLKMVVVALFLALAIIATAGSMTDSVQAVNGSIPNNHPQPNPGGKHATFSTQGSVDLTGEFFQAQGANGRSCASCHTAGDAWSITPATVLELFDATAGTHPIFNELDANNPDTIDSSSTVEELRAGYSMLLTHGVFRRGGTPRANSEWELIAVDDPHGYARINRLVHWRRSMPTSDSRWRAPSRFP